MDDALLRCRCCAAQAQFEAAHVATFYWVRARGDRLLFLQADLMQIANTFPVRSEAHTVWVRLNRNKVTWLLSYVCLLGITALAARQMLRDGPNPAILGWMCYWAGTIAIVYRP